MSINIENYSTLNKYTVLASGDITGLLTYPLLITGGEYGSTTQKYQFIEGTVNNNDVNDAHTDLTKLINDINALSTGTVINSPVTNTETTYYPGTYDVSSSIIFNGTPIILDGLGNTNPKFYFRVNHSITFQNVPSIILKNGASSCNIFWVSLDQILFKYVMPPECPGIFISCKAFAFLYNSANIVGRIYSQSVIFFATPGEVNNSCTDMPQNISFRYKQDPLPDPGPVICYVKGTLILTQQGLVPIENIKAGHNIVTKGKIYKQKYVDKDAYLQISTVIWISKFKVFHLNSKSKPICIEKNALGKNLPFKNLYVSPDHSLLLNGKMVSAKHMVNGTTIYQDNSERESVEYYHLECENHSVLFANGILAETYLEGLNNRDVFDYSMKLRRKINLKNICALR